MNKRREFIVMRLLMPLHAAAIENDTEYVSRNGGDSASFYRISRDLPRCTRWRHPGESLPDPVFLHAESSPLEISPLLST